MVNKPLMRPYFAGSTLGGGWWLNPRARVVDPRYHSLFDDKVFSKINKTPYFFPNFKQFHYTLLETYILPENACFLSFLGERRTCLLWAKELAFVSFSPGLASPRKQGFLQDWFPLSQAGYKTLVPGRVGWLVICFRHLFNAEVGQFFDWLP